MFAEIGKYSLFISNRSNFISERISFWMPFWEVSKRSNGAADVIGTWLGLYFAGSRTV